MHRLIILLCLACLLAACSNTQKKGFTAVNPDIDVNNYISAPKQPDVWSFNGLRNDVDIHKSEQAWIHIEPENYTDYFSCGGILMPEYSGAIWKLEAVKVTNYSPDGYEIYIPMNDLIPDAEQAGRTRYFYFSFKK